MVDGGGEGGKAGWGCWEGEGVGGMHRNCRIPIESKLSHHPNAQKRGQGRYLCSQISSHKVAAPFVSTLGLRAPDMPRAHF